MEPITSESLKDDSKSKSHFAGETTLIIKHPFETGSKSYFGPSDESGIDASEILVYVEGAKITARKRRRTTMMTTIEVVLLIVQRLPRLAVRLRSERISMHPPARFASPPRPVLGVPS